MAHSTTWKTVERKIAALLGGSRRGADYRNRDKAGGKNDVIGVVGYSIEIKHSTRPTFGLAIGALEQAASAKENENDEPIAVIHQKGRRISDSIVFVYPDMVADLVCGSGFSVVSRLKYSEIEKHLDAGFPENVLPAVHIRVLDKHGILVHSVVAIRLESFRSTLFLK